MTLATTTRLVALIAAILLVSACGSSPAGEGENGDPMPQGTWGEEAERSPHLVLKDEGGVIGSDGCNKLRGSYKVEDGELRFLMQPQTLMACEGVDTWLSKLYTATIEGDTFTGFDRDGNEIGTLDRTA